MILDAQLIRIDPVQREIRLDIDGSLASAELGDTLKVIEVSDEFSG